MENSRPGTRRSNSLVSVVFPEPDGAEMMNRIPLTLFRRASLVCDTSFNVLDLLTRFLDLGFHAETNLGNAQGLAGNTRRLRQKRVCFAAHFLQQEVKLLADFSTLVQQPQEMLDVGLHADKFLADVAA